MIPLTALILIGCVLGRALFRRLTLGKSSHW